MKNEFKEANESSNLLFNQALLVAVELSKAQAIVEHAFGAADIAMTAIEKSDHLKLPEIARETLQIARHAATEILKNAKREAEEMLRLTNERVGEQPRN